MRLKIFKRKNKNKKENTHVNMINEKKAFDMLMEIKYGKTYEEYLKEETKGMYLFEIQEFKRNLDKELTKVVRRIAYEMAR